MTDNKYTGLEVAVIGISCRFPGANDWRAYWENLQNGLEAVEQLEGKSAPNFVPSRVVLQGKDQFDPGFFDYRPAEAILMNPQLRLFHECVWEALEDAGYDPFQTQAVIGLFAGGNENVNWKLYSTLKNKEEEVDAYTLDYLNNRDYLASLVAYKLNLKGPAVSVNTACSTSLVTVNMAYKSLLLGETDMALAGGISLVTQRQDGYYFEEGMIASRDGHCRAFDKLASGTIRGEGAGVVLLKRLKDAIRDRDNIYAIIKGAAINNDGKQKVGFTAPAVEGQAECIKRAHKFAQVAADSISYIETHGTGTRLGDVIEIEALNRAFGYNTNHRCAIGSVKTNLGHLDTAAGIAGFIKTVLALKHQKIPASLHFREPNPEIAFNKGPFYVNSMLDHWARKNDLPRRAGVSSFGIGGTNAHIILEEAPDQTDIPENNRDRLLLVSARNERSLERYLQRISEFIRAEKELRLSDLCFTMCRGRRHFEVRRSFAFASREALLQLLDKKMPEQYAPGEQPSAPKVVFLFPGQGSQYENMGRSLYRENEYFRKIMNEGFEELTLLTGIDFKPLLYGDDLSFGNSSIHQTRYTQPLLFLFEYAVSRLLMAAGIVPDYLTGHSVGEYTAAVISGVFSLSDALKIINRRAELLAAITDGSMLSAAITETEAMALLNEHIALAAINSPGQVVFSGSTAAVELLAGELKKKEIPHAFLKVSCPFHSHLLDPLLDNFEAAFDGIKMNPPAIPFISNVTGKLIEPAAVVTPKYWVEHLRSTVRFADGILHLDQIAGNIQYIEAGPGKILSGLVSDHKMARQAGPPVALIRNRYEPESDHTFFLQQAGKLWEAGLQIQWPVLLDMADGQRISVPAYPFDHAPYPVEVPTTEEQLLNKQTGTADALLKEKEQQLYYTSWRRSITGSNSKIQPGTFLYFSSGDPDASRLAAQLERSGHRVLEILIADRYNKVADNRYEIGPGFEADFKAAFADIAATGAQVTGIIYAWPQVSLDEPGVCSNSTQMDLLYFGIIYCVRNLATCWPGSEMTLTVLTTSLQQVLGTESIRSLQALSTGLLPSIRAEYGMEYRMIDCPEKEEVIHLLAKEICSPAAPGSCTAFRHGHRWIRSFEPLTQPLEMAAGVLKEGATYIITGGLGNAGYCLAGYLLHNYKARLILVGREAEQLGHANSDSTQKWQRLRELEKLSSAVTYRAVDVSNEAAVRKMADEIRSEYGAVNGIIHAAGVLDNRYFDFVEDMTVENSRIVFGSKISGIENIDAAFRDHRPDFIWVTSSISSVTGGLGFAAYAAANSYIDAFVTAKSTTSGNWTSVAFSELAVAGEMNSGRVQALDAEAFCRIFEYSSGSGTAPVLYQSKVGMQLPALKKSPAAVLDAGATGPAASFPAETKKARRMSNEFVAPSTATEQKLASLFEVFFGVDSIGTTDNFFELGGDSLKGMILLKRTNAAFAVNLQLADFLKNPDIRSLAITIEQLVWLQSNNTMKHEITI